MERGRGSGDCTDLKLSIFVALLSFSFATFALPFSFSSSLPFSFSCGSNVSFLGYFWGNGSFIFLLIIRFRLT